MRIIEEFPVSKGTICLMSALKDILSYHQYHIDESSLLGLCEGNLFYFGGLKGPAQNLLVTDTYKLLKMGGMKYNIKQMMNRLGENLGLHIEGFIINTGSFAKERIQAYIDRGIPLLALVMAYHLEYSTAYQKDLLSHTISIYGYDYDEGKVYVTDTFVNTKPLSTYKGKLDIQKLIDSFDLSDALFEMQTEERLYAIYPENRRDFKDIPVEAFHQSLVNMAENNLSGLTLGKGICSGISGIRAFTEQMLVWQKELEPELLNKIWKGVHHLLTNFGGPSVTSRMLSEYLTSIYNREKDDRYQQYASEFQELQRLWLVIANMCYRGALRGDFSCYGIISRLDEVRDKSEQLYTMIRSTLSD